MNAYNEKEMTIKGLIKLEPKKTYKVSGYENKEKDRGIKFGPLSPFSSTRAARQKKHLRPYLVRILTYDYYFSITSDLYCTIYVLTYFSNP